MADLSDFERDVLREALDSSEAMLDALSDMLKRSKHVSFTLITSQIKSRINLARMILNPEPPREVSA